MFQEGMKPGKETRMPVVPLPVPSLPPTMTSCSCIKISYFLQVIYPLSVHLAEFFKISDVFFVLTTVVCCLANIFPLRQTNHSYSGLNDRTCIWCEFIWWWNIFRMQVLLTNTGIQYLESGIHCVESRIQDCLGYRCMGRPVTQKKFWLLGGEYDRIRAPSFILFVFSFALKPRLARNNYDFKCRGLFHSLANESWKCSNKVSWNANKKIFSPLSFIHTYWEVCRVDIKSS